VDHVLIRRLEHIAGTPQGPALRFGVEARERPGPLHKLGAFQDDQVWVQLHGGLLVARAVVQLCWVGEYSSIDDLQARTKGSPLYEREDFWKGRPRYGYAAVAELQRERWLDEPFWAGPRTYGYEWIRLEDDKKRRSWLDPKEPPRGGEDLLHRFRTWARRA
jgi:hypothetical protein